MRWLGALSQGPLARWGGGVRGGISSHLHVAPPGRQLKCFYVCHDYLRCAGAGDSNQDPLANRIARIESRDLKKKLNI